jgi:hypothetical protein
VFYLNPLRSGKITFNSKVEPIPYEFLPAMDVAIALAADQVSGINLLPLKLKKQYKLIPLFNFLLVILITTFISLGIFSIHHIEKRGNLKNQVEQIEKEWSKVSPVGKNYSILASEKMSVQSVYDELLKDEQFSKEVISILKLFSNITPPEINLTEFSLSEVTVPDQNEDSEGSGKDKSNESNQINRIDRIVRIMGFVSANPAVADIILANYQVKLEDSQFFVKVVMDRKSRLEVDGENQLYFTLLCYLE